MATTLTINDPQYIEEIHEHSILTFGSHLKRLADLMFGQVQDLYDRRCKEFKPAWFGFLIVIKENPEIDIKSLAAMRRVSHSAASQVIRDMLKAKIIQSKKLASDKRSKTLSITQKGLNALQLIVPELKLIEETLIDLLGEDMDEVITRLNYIESELKAKPFNKRVISTIKVEKFNSCKHSKAFEVLNRAWLEKRFKLEKYDEDQLKNPQKIIDADGEILVATDHDEPIGTLALIHHCDNVVEISKTCVDETYQGMNVSHLLMDEAIRLAAEKGYREILILSNSKLKRALALYQKYGFNSYPITGEMKEKYGARADVSLRLILT